MEGRERTDEREELEDLEIREVFGESERLIERLDGEILGIDLLKEVFRDMREG